MRQHQKTDSKCLLFFGFFFGSALYRLVKAADNYFIFFDFFQDSRRRCGSIKKLTANAFFFSDFFLGQPYTGWSKQPIIILFFWIFFKTADGDAAASKI